jgi:hypothetical protein
MTMDTEGPVSRLMRGRPPFGPIEKLDPARLREEHAATLASPRSPSLVLRGPVHHHGHLVRRGADAREVQVLELVARVPYQAWENVAYVAVTHTARAPGFARRIFDHVRINRWEQDNEQWHLLMLEELVGRKPAGSWLRNRLVPQILALGYYWYSWLTYAIEPRWSYRLNADFEDHAEHEYALLVQEHPEWETKTFDSTFTAEFGQYDSLADLFRQIGYDERLHKLQSEAAMNARGSRDQLVGPTRR